MSFDHYYDPPEEDTFPECPKCEDGYGEFVKEEDRLQTYRCDLCQHEWQMTVRFEYPVDDEEFVWDDEPVQLPETCPHGIEWAECNDCMIASDQAYDAARERRFFR